MALKKSSTGIREGELITLPADVLARVFRQVAYRRVGREVEVVFHLLVPPGEEWQTVFAIEASESMRHLWGKTLTGDVPLPVQEDYHRRNLVLEVPREGTTVRLFQPEAYEDAIAKGFLTWTGNEVQSKAREIMEYLAGKVSSRNVCRLLYWGCERGDGVMDLGKFKGVDCRVAAIPGEAAIPFGSASRMLPLVQHLVDGAVPGSKTLVVVLTDGRFSDLAEVQSYCSTLAPLIKAQKKTFLKFVAVGLGSAVDRKSLDGLEGLEIGGDIQLWDVCLADELEDPGEMLAGMTPEDLVVAPGARVLDAKDNVVKEFSAGLTGKGTFRMPLESTSFSLQILPAAPIVKQSLLLPFRKNLL